VRCLFLCPVVPYPLIDGGRIRIYHLLTGLAKRHQVDVLCLDSDAHDPSAAVNHFSEIGVHLDVVPHKTSRLAALPLAAWYGCSLYRQLFSSRLMRARLAQRLRTTAYDVIQCEYAYMAPYVTKERGPVCILDEHNIEFMISRTLADSSGGFLYQLYARREAKRREQEELAACRGVDRVVVVSTVDQQRLRAVLPEVNVSVVPNGVDLDYFDSEPTPAAWAKEAVFVGKLDYRPNCEAVAWFCTQVLPLVRSQIPDFHVRFVGSGCPTRLRTLEGLPGVSFAGFVEDTRPYLRNAAVVVIPIRAGSGTRLKVLEALAMGAGIVTTSAGCEGIDLQAGVHALLADTPELFATQVVRVIGNPQLRVSLGGAGRRLVESKYGWPSIVDRLDQLYQTAIHAASRRTEKCA